MTSNSSGRHILLKDNRGTASAFGADLQRPLRDQAGIVDPVNNVSFDIRDGGTLGLVGGPVPGRASRHRSLYVSLPARPSVWCGGKNRLWSSGTPSRRRDPVEPVAHRRRRDAGAFTATASR